MSLLAPQFVKETSLRRLKYVYLLFGVTLVPLIIVLANDRETVQEKILRTAEQHPEVLKQPRIKIDDDLYDVDKIVASLPDRQLIGAHLPGDSGRPLIYAAISGVLFFAVVGLLFPRGTARLSQFVRAALFTSTCGLGLLFALQLAGMYAATEIHNFSIYLLPLRGIGVFYYATMMAPDRVPFIMVFGSYVFGIGLCEELVKLIPTMHYLGKDGQQLDWRASCWWGLASGVGFGVAEGIIYAFRDYNGVYSANIYVVRFVSCVALHAIWSGTTGILLARTLSKRVGEIGFLDWIAEMSQILLPVAFLHGAYDTFLQRDIPSLAIVSAICSFALFLMMFERCQRHGLPSGRLDPTIAQGGSPKDWARRGRR